MKNKKSKVLVIALIAGVAAIISLGTLAWFTAKDEVTNTIRLADKFEIQVVEHDFNKPNTPETTEEVTYTNLLPGQTIRKDPTVRNTGSVPEWVRVKVTVNHYEIWKDYFTSGTDLTKIFGGYDDAIWEQDSATPEVASVSGTNSAVTLTFYMRNKLQPYNDTDNNQYTLFDSVKIPEALTLDDAKEMNDGFTIKVEAEAIQAENLPEGVDTAQEAFGLLNRPAE